MVGTKFVWCSSVFVMKKLHLLSLFLVLLARSHSIAYSPEELEGGALVFHHFSMFDFILMNYASLSQDILRGDGDYLNVVVKHYSNHDPQLIIETLRKTLRESHSIVEFTEVAMAIAGE